MIRVMCDGLAKFSGTRMWWAAFCLFVGVVGVAQAQVDVEAAEANSGVTSGIRLRIQPFDVGYAGRVRPGDWTPLRVTATNNSEADREVVLQWRLRDDDGDTVQMERTATLAAGREQTVWLYAAVPLDQSARPDWEVLATDSETGEALARVATTVEGNNLISTSTKLVGVLGSGAVGLERLTPHITRHEQLQLINGWSLESLPDRWYGLSSLSTVIWMPQDGGGDPLSTQFTESRRQALREWVYRGGHLVLILPAVGQGWSDSPLGDLMPVDKQRIERANQPVPPWAGLVADSGEVDMLKFDVNETSGVSVIEPKSGPSPEGLADVVAKRYGFGRVTAIGLDLGSTPVQQKVDPNNMHPVWSSVFDWRGETFTESYAKAQETNPDNPLRFARNLPAIELGGWISRRLAMTGTAAPALLLAILVFAAYWIAAGPGLFMYLRYRKLDRWNWAAFVAVVGVFALMCWGGAALLRPSERRVEHVTFLDVDVASGVSKTKSWVSVFVPRFGDAEVAFASEQDEEGNPSIVLLPEVGEVHQTLASPGVSLQQVEGAYVDPRRYDVRSDRPSTVEFPVRATSKQFVAHWVGKLESGAWTTPSGQPTLNTQGRPSGQIAHGYAQPLTNVKVVYTAGGASEPVIAFLDSEWTAGQLLKLDELQWRLMVRDGRYVRDRQWKEEGHLGLVVERLTQGANADPVGTNDASESRVVRELDAAMFYDTLPPPNIRLASGFSSGATLQRSMLRDADLTPLMDGRRLIIIGYLEGSALPTPLELDGEALEAQGNGLTVVRLIFDL